MARQVNRRFAHVRATAVHPGFVASSEWRTILASHSFPATNRTVTDLRLRFAHRDTDLYVNTSFSLVQNWAFISNAEGALASLYGATSPEIEREDSW